jgi:hypothetical protein
MFKTVDHQVLTTWLKEQADKAVDGVIESLSDLYTGCEVISDDTPLDKLPPLLTHENPVFQLLAKERLAGHSVSGREVLQGFIELCRTYKTEEGETIDFGRYTGMCYAWGELSQALGDTEAASLLKDWGLIRANL